MLQQDFIAPGSYVDSDAANVIAFARDAADGADTDLARVLRLYVAVRDRIVYDPYVDLADPANFRASSVLAAGRGFCIGKAALLAACARADGIPARVGFADVKNHLTTPALRERMGTDLFIYHGYTELLLEGRWVKATPAFNSALCRRLGLDPLAFDGRTDSLLHPFDRAGRLYMEYLNDRGPYADVPFDAIMAAFRAHYPKLMTNRGLEGDFQAEAIAGATVRQTA